MNLRIILNHEADRVSDKNRFKSRLSAQRACRQRET